LQYVNGALAGMTYCSLAVKAMCIII